MHHTSMESFLKDGAGALAKGPVAIVLVEDDVEVATTLRHHQQAGFVSVVVLMPAQFDLPLDLQESVHRIDYNLGPEGAMEDGVNQIIASPRRLDVLLFQR